MTDATLLVDDDILDAGALQASQDIIDRVTLTGQVCGDAALERDVLDLFLDQSLVWTREIRETNDMNVRRRAAHTLKGSALSIGARKLAARAGRIEDLGEGSDEDEVMAAMSELHASVAEARASIAAMLTGGRAAI